MIILLFLSVFLPRCTEINVEQLEPCLPSLRRFCRTEELHFCRFCQHLSSTPDAYWTASSASLQIWELFWAFVNALPRSPWILFIDSAHLFLASMCFVSNGFVKGYHFFPTKLTGLITISLEKPRVSTFRLKCLCFFLAKPQTRECNYFSRLVHPYLSLRMNRCIHFYYACICLIPHILVYIFLCLMTNTSAWNILNLC